MTIGETLKRARKKMDLELDDVAHQTKIAKMFLIALENDDVSRMPGGVYTRNFLRTYAKFLNLDEDILTAEYHEQYQVKPHFVLQQEQTKSDDQQFQIQRRRFFFVVLVLVAIIAAVLYFWQPWGTMQWSVTEIREEVRSNGADESAENVSEGRPEVAPPVIDRPETEEPVNADTARDGDDTDAGVGPADTEQTETVGDAVDQNGVQAETESFNDETSDENQPSDEQQTAENEKKLDETTGENTDGADTTPEATDSEEERTLPVNRLQGIMWTPPENSATVFEEMFAIESLDKVWLKVTIDGEILTNRSLRRGQVRYYKYGQNNSVTIGDASKVAIQDGTRFKKIGSRRPAKVSLRNFGSSELMPALEKKLDELSKPIAEE